MEKTATLTNLDRAEYGTISVDLDLLRTQINWLAGVVMKDPCPEGDGILNLLEGIQDLADPPDAEAVWEGLGNIPVNDDGMIQEPFHQFVVGTHREDIWHWFEAEFNVSVHDLMFKKN